VIFVFGSNLAGRHGKGAALAAMREHGAVYGVGEGRTGNAYAIPTKGRKLQVLPVASIARSVETFLNYARAHPELTFQVTPIGTGLAGYRHDQIAPLFRGVPENCVMPVEWKGMYELETVTAQLQPKEPESE
jgi:hypothetical protein